VICCWLMTSGTAVDAVVAGCIAVVVAVVVVDDVVDVVDVVDVADTADVVGVPLLSLTLVIVRLLATMESTAMVGENR